jgi:hypothetical protein
MFSKAALSRHWERLVASSIAEWRGVWTRYQMSDGRLQAAPAFPAVCALKKGGCAYSGESGHRALTAIEQTNTYYEEGLDAAPKIVPMPVQTPETFGALAADKNSLIVLPDDVALVWSTLDFAAVPPPHSDGATGSPRIAALEFVCRFRSNRARVVLIYLADPSGADKTVHWRLAKLTSIRDNCQAGPHDAPAPPRADLPRFWEKGPVSSDGWIWEVKEVAVARGSAEVDGVAEWDTDLTESKSSGSVNGALVELLDATTARFDVPEPDILVHAPDELSFGGAAAPRRETVISVTWSAEKDVCLRASVVIDARGKLRTVSTSYWRHLHWKGAT